MTDPGTPIRVLIADDQRVLRDGLSLLVGLMDDVELVGAASDGAEAVRLSLAARPDVILMDLRMPNLDGTGATEQLRAVLPGARVLVLTTYVDDESLLAALQAGAAGYLTKDATAEEIEQAIRDVHAGRTHLDPVVQRKLVAAVTAPAAGPAAATRRGRPARLPDGLTAREAEVLGLIAAGLSNAEISQRLVVSPATVKTHVNRIFAKTGARDRAQAVRYAFDTGLADPG